MGEQATLHDPNPLSHEGFPILVLDIHEGQSVPTRMSFHKLHWHDDLQFVIVLAGSIHIDVLREHRECLCDQGAFVNAGIPHRIMGNKEASYTSLVFPSRVLEFFPGSDMAMHGVQPFIGAGAAPVAWFDGSKSWHAQVLEHLHVARQLLLEKSEGPAWADRYQAVAELVGAWGAYVRHADPGKPSSHTIAVSERMKQFVLYIDEHLSQHITLNDIASSAGVSASECSRCFHETLQTTPYAYLMNQRIDEACKLMRKGGVNITAIARMTGFGSTSHFSAAFRKATGMSPRAYLNALEHD